MKIHELTIADALVSLKSGLAGLSDAEAQRRPLFHRLVADGTLPGGYATDNGAGLLYRGTELAEAVTEVRGQGAYRVTAEYGQVREERLAPRVLPGSS